MGTFFLTSTQDDVRAILHGFAPEFERQRKFGPRQIVAVLMTMIRVECGYRRGLGLVHEHHGEVFGWGSGAPPTAGAFCRARRKLSPEDMRRVYRDALAGPTAVAARKRWRWKGKVVYAADGVRFLLPASAAVITEWGRPLLADGKEAYQPQLLQVTLWDVGAVQPLDWVHLPCRGKGHGERTGILKLIDRLGPGDVLLLDRGFPSRRLLFELLARGIHFVIRMTAGSDTDFTEVSHFLAGRSADRDVDFSYTDPDCADPLVERLRLVRTNGADGDVRVLVTNLSDRDLYSRHDLFELYSRRWGIENAFRDLKIRYACEDFHGTTPQFIEQEIVALMLLMLIESLVEETALMTLPAAQSGCGDDHRPQRCNRAALGDRIPTLIAIGLREHVPRHLATAFRRGIQACAADRTRVRRTRSYPRICRSQYGRWRVQRRHRMARDRGAA